MKTAKIYLIYAILFSAICVLFTSCEKDDNTSNKDVIGTWVGESATYTGFEEENGEIVESWEETDNDCSDEKLIFYEDYSWSAYDDGDEYAYGEWTTRNGKIYLIDDSDDNYDDVNNPTIYVESVSKSKLVIVNDYKESWSNYDYEEHIVMTYKRAK